MARSVTSVAIRVGRFIFNPFLLTIEQVVVCGQSSPRRDGLQIIRQPPIHCEEPFVRAGVTSVAMTTLTKRLPQTAPQHARRIPAGIPGIDLSPDLSIIV